MVQRVKHLLRKPGDLKVEQSTSSQLRPTPVCWGIHTRPHATPHVRASMHTHTHTQVQKEVTTAASYGEGVGLGWNGQRRWHEKGSLTSIVKLTQQSCTAKQNKAHTLPAEELRATRYSLSAAVQILHILQVEGKVDHSNLQKPRSRAQTHGSLRSCKPVSLSLHAHFTTVYAPKGGS